MFKTLGGGKKQQKDVIKWQEEKSYENKVKYRLGGGGGEVSGFF